MKTKRSGFTLTEVVFSLAILVLVWLAVVDAILINRTSTSFAKHKTQAIYVMQRTIEDLRKKSFASIGSSTSTVSIDTKGTPDNYSDDFTGTQVVTVTNLGSYKKVVVELRWNEIVAGRTKTMREYLGTNIANDPQVN